MRPLAIHRKGSAIPGEGGLSWESLPGEFGAHFPGVPVKYLDRLSQLTGVAAGRALGEEREGLKGGDHPDFAVVFGSAFGALDSVAAFDAQALKGGPNSVNPMDFPNTVANAAGSLLGIWLKLRGPNVTLTNGPTSFLDAAGFAWEGWNAGLFRRCLVGAGDKLPAFLPGVPSEAREGAGFLLAAGGTGTPLFEIEDYLSLQLPAGGRFPEVFRERWRGFWDNVEWWGGDTGPFLKELPPVPSDPIPSDPPVELGLGGWEALGRFLSGRAARGALAVHSREERKVSCLKIIQKRRE